MKSALVRIGISVFLAACWLVLPRGIRLPVWFHVSPVLAQAAPVDAALLPADGVVEGWRMSARPRVFTNADLYGRIDGGAEVFLELGFEQLLVQSYRRAAAAAGPVTSADPEIVVELYRMTDGAAARGIYLSKCGAETRDPSFRERHTTNRYQLMFQRNRFFVIVANSSGKETFQPALVKFGQALASRMPADKAVPELAWLSTPTLVAGSERIIRGPFGLQAIFTLGEGDMLQLHGRLTAVAGDYTDSSGGRMTLLVAEYGDAAAARSAMQYVVAHLDSYLTPVSKADSRLVFRDFEKKFGLLTVLGRRLELRLHLVKTPGPARP